MNAEKWGVEGYRFLRAGHSRLLLPIQHHYCLPPALLSLNPTATTEPHMDVVDTAPPADEKSVTPTLARTASLLALPVLGTLSYGAPYITGFVYRQSYLHQFNIPDNLFPSDTAAYFTYAYMAVLSVRQDWMAFLANPLIWSGMIIAIAALGLEIVLLYKLPKPGFAASVSKKLLRNTYVAISVGLVSLSAAITTLILLIPLLLFPLIIMPGIVGSYGAKHAVEQDLATFNAGCAAQHVVKDQCHALTDGTHVVAAGFVVAASDTRVAIYRDHVVRIIPLKDFTLEALSPERYDELVTPRSRNPAT